MAGDVGDPNMLSMRLLAGINFSSCLLAQRALLDTWILKELWEEMDTGEKCRF